MRCWKCLGRKEMWKIGAGYSLENPSGKKPVKCPQCLGSGQVPDPDQEEKIKEEIKKERKKKKK